MNLVFYSADLVKNTLKSNEILVNIL